MILLFKTDNEVSSDADVSGDGMEECGNLHEGVYIHHLSHFMYLRIPAKQGSTTSC